MERFNDGYYQIKEETSSLITEQVLNHPVVFLNEIIKMGISSIETSNKVIEMFEVGIKLLKAEDCLTFQNIFEEKLSDLSWLNIDKREIHKAWLLLLIFRCKLFESFQVGPEKWKKKFNDLYLIADQRGNEISRYKEKMEKIENENKSYSDIFKSFQKQILSIKEPTVEANISKRIHTLKWAITPILINDLFKGLKVLNLIHEDTSQEVFILAFSGVLKNDLPNSIIWKGSVRLLAYLMDQLDMKDWISDGNSWPSTIAGAEIFICNSKKLKANNLFQVRVQINNHFPKGMDQIDDLISHISYNYKQGLKSFLH